MQLRPYQLGALDSVRAHIRAGRRRVVLVAPTGSGKTTIGAEMVRSAVAKGSRVLWVAHRTVLIEQASARLADERIAHNIAMGGASVDRRAPVTLGSIQTLSRRHPDRADLVVVDEAHHATAKGTYANLLAHYPQAAVVGLTATPRDGMGDCFDALEVAATPAGLMAEGYLAQYRGWAFVAPDLKEVHTKKGDYVESELSAVYAKSAVFGDVVEKWGQHSRGISTICFAAGIDNSLALVARFRAAGIRAEHLDYRSLPSDRAAIFDRVRRRDTLVLCNYSLLGEGLDLPLLKCVILARPTKSEILALQMMGRGLRPWEGQVCHIHDHAGIVQAHGLPDMDRKYQLSEGRPPSPPALTTCKHCLAIWVRSAEAPGCPCCGQVPDPVERGDSDGPEQHDQAATVDLRNMGRLPSRAVQLELFRELLSEARNLGRRPGSAIHGFKERFPGAPLPWGEYRKQVDKQTKTWRDVQAN